MSFSGVVGELQKWGPVFFGVGFVAPLVAQLLDAGGLTAPFGVGNGAFGIAVGISAGLLAKRRGSWV